jgi:hypothetical protein
MEDSPSTQDLQRGPSEAVELASPQEIAGLLIGVVHQRKPYERMHPVRGPKNHQPLDEHFELGTLD